MGAVRGREVVPVRRPDGVRSRPHTGALLRPMSADASTVAARLKELSPLQRAAVGAVGAVVAWIGLGAALPNGLPFGVVLLGLVLGGLTSLTAMGLVLIYRSSRIINFAQVEIGGFAAVAAQVMVRGWGVSYFIALPIGLAIALLTGAVI